MSNLSIPTQQEVQKQVRRAVRHASRFVEKFARIGYAARGTIYTMVGLLSLLAALGERKHAVGGPERVMAHVFHQPFGQLLIIGLAIGLACHAMWLLILAINDPEFEGTGLRGARKRVGYFIGAIIHAALVVFAIKLMFGYVRRADDNAAARGWSATIMSYPPGRLCVAGIGIGFVITAVVLIRQGWRAQLDRVNVSKFSPTIRNLVCRVCQFGIIARGVVFAIVGVFFIVAAYDQRPSEARGLSGALDALRDQPYGAWLLAIVALGLMSYGFYEFVRAGFRRITPPTA